jgi:hypothetical protein
VGSVLGGLGLTSLGHFRTDFGGIGKFQILLPRHIPALFRSVIYWWRGRADEQASPLNLLYPTILDPHVINATAPAG